MESTDLTSLIFIIFVFVSIFYVTDWLPTLFESAGGPMEKVSDLNGVSHFKAMVTTDTDYPRDELFLHLESGSGIMRCHNFI